MTEWTKPPSTVARVWAVPEIVLSIMQHLRRERVDLLQLSLTSKNIRRLALTVLVRELDLVLSRARKVGDLLQYNSELLAEIKHVRLWDDEVHYEHRWRGPMSPASSLAFQISRQHEDVDLLHPLDPVISSKWYAAQKVLSMIFSRTTDTPPTVDISFGIGNIGSFKLALARSGCALAAVVGLRVVVDFVEEEQMSGPTSGFWRGLTGLAQWDALRGLVQDIAVAQRSAGAARTRLQLFHIEDCSTERTGRHSMQDFIWKSLAAELSPMLQSLRLHLSEADLDGGTGFVNNAGADFFRQEWPNLRRLALIILSFFHDPDAPIEASVSSFFQRHPLLEDIEIHGTPVLSNLVFQSTFPNLRALSVSRVRSSVAFPFLNNHTHLAEFRVRHPLVQDETTPLLPLPHLRVVRAPIEFIQSLNAAGTFPAEIDLAEILLEHESYDLPSWFPPGSPQAEAITCLSLKWSFGYYWNPDGLEEVIPSLGFLLSTEHFPALCELVVICDGSAGEGGVHVDHEPMCNIRQALVALSPAHKLRALHLKKGFACELDKEDLPERPITVPPALEYISWHSFMENKTTYIRVIRDGPHKNRGRLEMLDSSFGLRSSGPGLWDVPGLRRRDDTLLNHSVSPPQFKQ